MSRTTTSRPSSEATLKAYQVARARTAAAAQVEAELLHDLVFDAQEGGLSVRETAALLQVPKSTVSRHRLNVGTGRYPSGRTWITTAGYVQAYNAAFVADPDHHIDYAPFVLEQLPDGSTRFQAMPMDRRRIKQFRDATDR